MTKPKRLTDIMQRAKFIADIMQRAKFIADIATGEKEEVNSPDFPHQKTR